MVANRRVITGLFGILCATMATVGRAHPQHRRGEPNSFNDEQQVDVSKNPTPQQQFPDASMGGAGGDEAGMVGNMGGGMPGGGVPAAPFGGAGANFAAGGGGSGNLPDFRPLAGNAPMSGGAASMPKMPDLGVGSAGDMQMPGLPNAMGGSLSGGNMFPGGGIPAGGGGMGGMPPSPGMQGAPGGVSGVPGISGAPPMMPNGGGGSMLLPGGAPPAMGAMAGEPMAGGAMPGGATLPGGSPVAGGPGAMPMGAGAGAGGGPPPAPPSGGAGESGDAFTPPPLDAKGNPVDDTKILKGKPKGLPPAPAMPPPPPKGEDKVIPTDPSTGLPINEPDLPDPANVHPLNSQNAPGKTPAISARRRLL